MATGRTARVFEVSRRDVPYRRAIIVGITGASFAGKTYSGLRMGTGFKRVLGGKIYLIDTDGDRARHYEDYFEFEHVPLTPPHGPLDYLDAINDSVGKGARVIIVDHMTHEHDGEGGVLDQIERFIEQKEAEYAAKDWHFNRETFNFSAQIKPKRERKQLNQRIVQLARDVVFILLYQAQEKIRPRKKGETDDKGKPIREPEMLGWQPITTSKLPYDMTVRFLLTPASDGVPLLLPPNPEEKKLIKLPEQFKGWFREGEQISEEMGERLAKWAIGKGPAVPPGLADYEACTDRAAFDALEKRRAEAWNSMQPSAKTALKRAADAAKSRFAAGAAAVPSNVQAELTGEQLTEQTALARIREAQSVAEVDAIVAQARRDIGGEFPVSVDAAAHDRREALAQL